MKNLVLRTLLAALLFAGIHHASAQIAYTLTTPTDPVQPGQVLEFDLTASNLSSTGSGGYTVNFAVPANTTYVSNGAAAGTTEDVYIDGLAPGQSQIVQIYLKVNSGNTAPLDLK